MSQTATRRVLGGNRDFTLLWSGGVISAIGSSTSLVTYPLLVLVVTGSPALVGIAMTVSVVVRLLVGLPGGLLVDRVNKKQLMLLCDLGRVVSQGALGLAILVDSVGYPVILLAVAVESALTTVFRTAEPTAVRLVVPGQQLAAALARNEARGAAALLAGPPIGGLLFGLAPWLPFLADALSYLVSFLMIAMVRTRMTASSDGHDKSGTREIMDGLAFVWRQKFLRMTMLLIAGNNMVSNAITMVAIVLSQQRGDAELTTGLILTISGIGSLAGALVAPMAVRLLSVRAILVVNRLVWTASIALMLFIDSTLLMAALIALMFFLGPTGSTAITTRQMKLTPEEMQGRGRAAAGLVGSAATPVGTALVGFGLEAAAPEATIAAMATFVACMALLAATSRPIREQGAVRVGAE